MHALANLPTNAKTPTHLFRQGQGLSGSGHSRTCALIVHLPPRGWYPSSETAALQDLFECTVAERRPFNKQKLAERQKAYFQCLLALPSLFALGLTTFAHSERVSYYMLLLRAKDPAGVLPGRPAKAYQSELKGLPDDELPALTDGADGAQHAGPNDGEMLALCLEESDGDVEEQRAAETTRPFYGGCCGTPHDGGPMRSQGLGA